MSGLGNPCKYDKEFICYKWGECSFGSLSLCLKTNVVALLRENEALKHRKMLKHSQASIKWRNQAFYFKTKARQLEAYLMTKGFDTPDTQELESLTLREPKRRTPDEGLRDNGKKKKRRKGRPIRSKKDGVGSKDNSDEPVSGIPVVKGSSDTGGHTTG